jgi:hypothetical protein
MDRLPSSSHESPYKLVDAQLEELVLYAISALVLDGGEGVLYDYRGPSSAM